MTVLITGISGFLAGHLGRALHGDGLRVVGFGRRALPAFDFAPGDVRDRESLDAALRVHQPTVVYHLAAISTIQGALGEDGPAALWETNVRGTQNVLDACRAGGVPALVLASSDKQYGTRAALPYGDNDEGGFVNGGVYELSKAQADQLARLAAGLYDLPAIRVARLVNLYGPGDANESRIVPGTILRCLRGVSARVTAGPAGQATREYLFVDDAVRALRALAADALACGNGPHRRRDGKLARVGFNIGSPHRHSAAGVIGTIRRVLADEFGVPSPEPEIQPSPGGVFEGGDQTTDPTRLQALLPDWSPRSLEQGLRLTIPWYQK